MSVCGKVQVTKSKFYCILYRVIVKEEGAKWDEAAERVGLPPKNHISYIYIMCLCVCV